MSHSLWYLVVQLLFWPTFARAPLVGACSCPAPECGARPQLGALCSPPPSWSDSPADSALRGPGHGRPSRASPTDAVNSEVAEGAVSARACAAERPTQRWRYESESGELRATPRCPPQTQEVRCAGCTGTSSRLGRSGLGSRRRSVPPPAPSFARRPCVKGPRGSSGPSPSGFPQTPAPVAPMP